MDLPTAHEKLRGTMEVLNNLRHSGQVHVCHYPLRNRSRQELLCRRRRRCVRKGGPQEDSAPLATARVLRQYSAGHHWCRQLRELGHDARIIDARKVQPYRIAGPKGKNDINDAIAICETAGRPHMRFVPVKSAYQQPIRVVHRMRSAAVDEHKRIANRLRGLLAEFGIVITNGVMRTLLVHGARSELNFTAARRLDAKSRWAEGLKKRMAWNKAAVALANKHARIAWAVLAHDADYQPAMAATA